MKLAPAQQARLGILHALLEGFERLPELRFSEVILGIDGLGPDVSPEQAVGLFHGAVEAAALLAMALDACEGNGAAAAVIRERLRDQPARQLHLVHPE